MRSRGKSEYVAIACTVTAVTLAVSVGGAADWRQAATPGRGAAPASQIMGAGPADRPAVDVAAADKGKVTWTSSLRELPWRRRTRHRQGQEPDPIADGAARSEWQRDRAVPQEGASGRVRHRHDPDGRADRRPGAVPPAARQRLVPRVADLRASQRADRRSQGRRDLLQRRRKCAHVPLAHRGSRRDRQEIRAAIELQQRILFPRPPQGRGGAAAGAVARPRTTVTVTPKSGTAVSGVLVEMNDFTVTLRDASGATRTFERTPA